MWNYLRNLFRPLAINDPIFGKLTFRRGSRTWDGALTPPFAEVAVGLVVEADEGGPTERQPEFYRELIQRYSDLRDEIENSLLGVLQNWDPSIVRQDVWNRFTFESMSVSGPSHDSLEWELCYTLSDDPHYFCVIFDNWIPQGVRVDG